jgi:hypothetical protein
MDEMRYYCRFSKEFGKHDVRKKEGEHSTDHICSHNFKAVMGNIYLSMIPYKIKDEII